MGVSISGTTIRKHGKGNIPMGDKVKDSLKKRDPKREVECGPSIENNYANVILVPSDTIGDARGHIGGCIRID
jgi:hypothetical protein